MCLNILKMGSASQTNQNRWKPFHENSFLEEKCFQQQQTNLWTSARYQLWEKTSKIKKKQKKKSKNMLVVSQRIFLSLFCFEKTVPFR